VFCCQAPTVGARREGSRFRVRPRQDRFVAEHPGALGARSPADFGPADLVVTMLPDGGVVRDALLGWGIAAALRPGAVALDMSSSDPGDTLRLATELEPFGIGVVDAPVSGGVPRAVTGELSVMVGGSAADIAAVQPVLRVLGDPARQFPTGALGTGHAMKALNNVVGAANCGRRPSPISARPRTSRQPTRPGRTQTSGAAGTVTTTPRDLHRKHDGYTHGAAFTHLSPDR
jgi:3-hydroxyisobutyrate dehydrogenase